MSPEEEALAAELSPSGGAAWSKLHANLTSQIQVPVDVDGEERLLPMSEVRNLAMNPDRDSARASLAGRTRRLGGKRPADRGGAERRQGSSADVGRSARLG